MSILQMRKQRRGEVVTWPGSDTPGMGTRAGGRISLQASAPGRGGLGVYLEVLLCIEHTGLT